MNVVPSSSDEQTAGSTQSQLSAEALENEQRMAGNRPDADNYEASASSDNPPGVTFFGDAEDNTPVEEGPPPDIGVGVTTPAPGTIPPNSPLTPRLTS